MRFGCFRLCCCCVWRYRPYSRWLILGGILVVLVVLLLWEENNYWGGNICKWYGNLYSQLLYFPISTRRTAILEVGENSTDVTRQLNIGIVVVMNLSKDGEEYRLAQNTLRCYCQFHEYSYLLIDLEAGSIDNKTDANVAQWKKRCTQTDFMFRRHCVLAQLLRHQQTFDYVLFMDADIGVINPNHLVEEYIRVPKADLVFYGRLFNHEVMAGSYIARRSDYAIEFLEKWADYFFKLPHSFHGSDNGAIHAVLLDQLCVDCAPTRKRICHELWATSVDYNDLSLFTSCVRSILGHRNLLMDENTGGLIAILSNFTGYWARDGWLTGNFWSADDFMLHGWQRSPFRIADDVGSAFTMGLVGGSIFHSLSASRNAARGQKLLSTMREVRMRGPLTGVQFAAWGGMFSTIDCFMVAMRKKEDAYNAIFSGAATGAVLAVRSGPGVMLGSAVLGGTILAMIEGVQILMGKMLSQQYDMTQQMPPPDDPKNLPSKPATFIASSSPDNTVNTKLDGKPAAAAAAAVSTPFGMGS